MHLDGAEDVFFLSWNSSKRGAWGGCWKEFYSAVSYTIVNRSRRICRKGKARMKKVTFVLTLAASAGFFDDCWSHGSTAASGPARRTALFLSLRGGAGAELVFPSLGLHALDDAVQVATALRRPLVVERGVHILAHKCELAKNGRLILAGPHPPTRQDDHDMPAVCHGRWALGGTTSGAFCDGVCFISRMQDHSLDPQKEEGAEKEQEEEAEKEREEEAEELCKPTVRVLSGPWYMEGVCVWAHDCTALSVTLQGALLAHASRFGGEADAHGLRASTAVMCCTGTASITLTRCLLGNTTRSSAQAQDELRSTVREEEQGREEQERELEQEEDKTAADEQAEVSERKTRRRAGGGADGEREEESEVGQGVDMLTPKELRERMQVISSRGGGEGVAVKALQGARVLMSNCRLCECACVCVHVCVCVCT